MTLRLGTTLRGSKYSFRLVEKLGDRTVFNPVFKAEVLPGIESLLPKNRWAVVKSADFENQTQIDCLLYDIINDPIGWTAQKPFCLAFEWMDTTLAEVPFEQYMKDPILVAKIVEVCLEAFVELEREHLVYSDLKPANVLISNVDGLLKVKIGDLGLAGPEGGNPRWVQPEAFRAPEVWTRVSCYHKADVWSIAAMILQRFDPNILGNADNIDKTLIHPMAWCLAKIILLFDSSCSSIPPPSDADKTLRAYFKLAQNLTTTQAEEDSNESLLQIPSFEVWANLAMNAGIPKVVLDIIRLLAVPNPTKRPSALQALQSPEYKALQEAAASYGN
ncbi:hypothetical protein VTL71DRAFT_11860 [Oculimacula yallundae]|uniref:Protein kinase domain-containing protein n=1 Tax=Oculimacula yallundae TaxID=86028 RepID=A0ABR4CRX1_9HELO